MADAPLVVRVAANLEQLRANLKEGVNQIETTSTAMKQMATAYDGSRAISQAGAVMAAIQQVGGVTSLTAAEQAKANRILDEAIQKYAALGRDAPAGMKALADATATAAKGTGDFGAQIKATADATATSAKWMGDFGAQIKATALGMISAQAVIGGVKAAFGALSEFVTSSIASFASAEAATKKMTVALDAQGTATPAIIRQYNELAATFQRTTVYSGDLITEMTALLTQVGNVGPQQMQKALTAATNLASGLGIDLTAATMLVAKGFAGHTESIGKYGIVLDEAKVKTEGMDYVLGQIQDRFGGQAQSEIETYGGKVKQLANNWDNFQEAVGKSIVDDPLIVAALRNAKESITGVSDTATEGTRTMTTFVAWLAGGSQAAAVIDFLSGAERAVQGLASDLKKLAPPPPKAFTDFGKDLTDLNKEADALVASMVKGWVETDKEAEKAHVAEQKRIKERNKAFEDSQAVFDRLVAQGTAIRLKQGATVREQEIADLKAQEAAEIESLHRRGVATSYNVSLTREKYKLLTDGLGTDWKGLEQISQATAETQRDDALKTYAYMTLHADQYTRGALDAQLQKYRDLRDAATASGRAAVDGQDAAAAAADRHTAALAKQKKIAEDLAAANDALIRSRSSTQDLAVLRQGDLDRAIGGHDADAIQRAILSIEQRYAANPGRRSGGNGSTGFMSGDEAGWAQLNAERVLYAQLQAALANLPKFGVGVTNAPGGMSVVGERGPEIMYVPPGANIYPTGTAPGAPTFHLTINVNKPLASAGAIGREVMNELRSLGTRFPIGV